ncbi:MAG: GAF domain-containing protein [Spirochaeta sp.]|nr:GAF domain-containing protein [Spirochaeta sp.]
MPRQHRRRNEQEQGCKQAAKGNTFCHTNSSIPYLAILPLVALSAGFIAALAAAVGALLWVAVLGPLVVVWLDLPASIRALELIPVGARYAAVVLSVSSAVVLSRIRRLQSELERTQQKSRQLEGEVDSVRHEAQALTLSLRTVNNRIATELSSITIMYEQMQRLQSLDQREVLDATLAGVRLITGATSCVIYRFHEQSLKLRRLAVWPARDESWYSESLTVASTIPGHVIRTGRPFSIREFVDQPELRSIDDQRTIICTPIVVRNQIWGVLSIGRLPFIRYNEYAEKGLQVVAALAAPALEHAMPSAGGNQRAAEPDDRMRMAGGEGEIESPVLPYEQLHTTLEEQTRVAEQLRYHIALILIELQTHLPEDESVILCETVGAAIAHTAGTSSSIFFYQQAGQLALVALGTSYDATGYLLLRVTELIGGRAWMVAEEMVLPQAVVGFGTSTQCGYDATKLIRRAEQVLALQQEMELDL